MKSINVQILSLIFILCIFASCKKNPTSQTISNTKYEFSGIIYEISCNDTLPLSGVIIKFDSARDTTDELGFFKFRNLESKEYILNIIYQDYYSIDTSIFINSNSHKNFSLIALLGDYFPLVVGNKWTYKFTSYERSGMVAEDQVWYDGIETWEIKHSYLYDTLQVYELEKNSVGIRIQQIMTDTFYVDTFTVANTESFTIEEDSNNFLHLNHSNFWEEISLNRYNKKSKSDTLIEYGSINEPWNNYEQYLLNYGLIKKYFYESSNSSAIKFEYNLLSSSLYKE